MNQKVLLVAVVILAVALAGTLVYFLGGFGATAIGTIRPTVTPTPTPTATFSYLTPPASKEAFTKTFEADCQKNPGNCPKTALSPDTKTKLDGALTAVARDAGFTGENISEMTNTQFAGFWQRLFLHIYCWLVGIGEGPCDPDFGGW